MPPENSDKTTVLPTPETQQPVVTTTQQTPPTQFPPTDVPQTSTPPIPEKRFPPKKLLIIAAAILIIVVIIGGVLAFYLFKTANHETSNSQTPNVPGLQATQSSQPISQIKTLWDNCQVLSNEADYLPDKIGEYVLSGKQSAETDTAFKSYGLEVIGTEGTYNVDVKGSTASADVITKTILEKGFGISVKKGTITPDGDITKTWTDLNNQVTANQGKQITGPPPINAIFEYLPYSKQAYYGNDALIYSISIKNVTTNTSLVSLISKHNMLVTLSMSGNSDRSKDVVEKYKKWFQAICQ